MPFLAHVPRHRRWRKPSDSDIGMCRLRRLVKSSVNSEHDTWQPPGIDALPLLRCIVMVTTAAIAVPAPALDGGT
jgi:hypothetical protein